MTYRLERATVSDAPLLTAIAWIAQQAAGTEYQDRWLERLAPQMTLTAGLIQRHWVYKGLDAHQRSHGFTVVVTPKVGQAELQHLFVLPHCQGKGLGKQLFKAACQYAQEQGYTQLFIIANPAAEPFYEHLGCVRVGNIPPVLNDYAPGRTLPRMMFSL